MGVVQILFFFSSNFLPRAPGGQFRQDTSINSFSVTIMKHLSLCPYKEKNLFSLQFWRLNVQNSTVLTLVIAPLAGSSLSRWNHGGNTRVGIRSCYKTGSQKGRLRTNWGPRKIMLVP